MSDSEIKAGIDRTVSDLRAKVEHNANRAGSFEALAES